MQSQAVDPGSKHWCQCSPGRSCSWAGGPPQTRSNRRWGGQLRCLRLPLPLPCCRPAWHRALQQRAPRRAQAPQEQRSRRRVETPLPGWFPIGRRRPHPAAPPPAAAGAAAAGRRGRHPWAGGMPPLRLQARGGYRSGREQWRRCGRTLLFWLQLDRAAGFAMQWPAARQLAPLPLACGRQQLGAWHVLLHHRSEGCHGCPCLLLAACLAPCPSIRRTACGARPPPCCCQASLLFRGWAVGCVMSCAVSPLAAAAAAAAVAVAGGQA